jgi:hypothetical protein
MVNEFKFEEQICELILIYQNLFFYIELVTRYSNQFDDRSDF